MRRQDNSGLLGKEWFSHVMQGWRVVAVISKKSWRVTSGLPLLCYLRLAVWLRQGLRCRRAFAQAVMDLRLTARGSLHQSGQHGGKTHGHNIQMHCIAVAMNPHWRFRAVNRGPRGVTAIASNLMSELAMTMDSNEMPAYRFESSSTAEAKQQQPG